jgi:hypothetical protein
MASVGGLPTSSQECRGLGEPPGGRIYVEHELPLKIPGSIVEIIVGPKAKSGAEDNTRALLKAEGYPDRIPVRRSTAVLPLDPVVLSAAADAAKGPFAQPRLRRVTQTLLKSPATFCQSLPLQR